MLLMLVFLASGTAAMTCSDLASTEFTIAQKTGFCGNVGALNCPTQCNNFIQTICSTLLNQEDNLLTPQQELGLCTIPEVGSTCSGCEDILENADHSLFCMYENGPKDHCTAYILENLPGIPASPGIMAPCMFHTTDCQAQYDTKYPLDMDHQHWTKCKQYVKKSSVAAHPGMQSAMAYLTYTDGLPALKGMAFNNVRNYIKKSRCSNPETNVQIGSGNNAVTVKTQELTGLYGAFTCGGVTTEADCNLTSGQPHLRAYMPGRWCEWTDDSSDDSSDTSSGECVPIPCESLVAVGRLTAEFRCLVDNMTRCRINDDTGGCEDIPCIEMMTDLPKCQANSYRCQFIMDQGAPIGCEDKDD